ncbi:phosphotransferase [Acidocella sp.]|uniref:phosphotransferase n=1 Tax=Acidocella sp. TaxID=50710 RepID=UPI00183CBCA4|nr:phosphotransferase [Acidocella sp.]NNM56068.1 phosphotransferase family protein [Acidocella sp.]
MGEAEVKALPVWTGEIKIWPLTGGITNRNFGVEQDDGRRFAVRLGKDIPEHGVMRFNEQAAARAAARAGLSPEIYYTAPGVMVSRLLAGRTLSPEEIRAPANLPRVAALIKQCHTGLGPYLQGPILAFWVFHINRSYGAALRGNRSSLDGQLERLLGLNDMLERRMGLVEVVFSHNDLLAGNIFDDGARLWLLDWDYAGFNSSLFDLANLASNNGFGPQHDAALLEAYFGRPPGAAVWDGFRVSQCASLLRETLWSAVSEITSKLDFDYAAYTAENLARFEGALAGLG